VDWPEKVAVNFEDFVQRGQTRAELLERQRNIILFLLI
jgi:hypothetical protein